MSEKNIVFVDIDHTVANTFWRDHMIGGPGGWDAYENSAWNDPPVKEMVKLVSSLRQTGYFVVGLTARPEKMRSLADRWLGYNEVLFVDLLMRPHGDGRSSPEVKLDLAKKFCPASLSECVAFVLEDRSDVSDAFRKEGVIVLQCHISAQSAISHPGPVSA